MSEASKSVEDCMRLADEYANDIDYPTCVDRRAALQAAITQLAIDSYRGGFYDAEH